MKKFYFNTGVNAKRYPAKKQFGQVDRHGTVQIPFECDNVPENAIFLYACNRVDDVASDMIFRKIHNSSLMSKYAIFQLPTKNV